MKILFCLESVHVYFQLVIIGIDCVEARIAFINWNMWCYVIVEKLPLLKVVVGDNVCLDTFFHLSCT